MTANSHARRLMWNHDLQPRHHRAMLAAMDRQSRIMPLALAFEGEALLKDEVLDDLHGADGQIDRDALRQWNADPVAPGVAIADRKQATEFLDTQYERFIAAARLPPWEALAEMERLEAEDVPPEHPLAALLIRLQTPAMRSRTQHETQWYGLRQMLALELFRAQHGNYPEDLQALVPQFLDSLPPDPYTGDAYRYRRFAPGEDEHGRGYLLYSVGLDRTDHGGRQHPSFVEMAGSPKGKGFDYIINAPPP